MIAALAALIAAVAVAVTAILADAAAGTGYLPGGTPPTPRLHMLAAVPVAHSRRSGTSGTSGTRPGQDPVPRFRRIAGVPEPPEPAEPAVGVPLTLTTAETDVLRAALADAAAYRRDRGEGYCADCLARPGGLCDDHADDLGRAGEYEGLAARLAAVAGDGAR